MQSSFNCFSTISVGDIIIECIMLVFFSYICLLDNLRYHRLHPLTKTRHTIKTNKNPWGCFIFTARLVCHVGKVNNRGLSTNYWKCNFPMTTHVRLSVDWLVRLGLALLPQRMGSYTPCFCRGTCFWTCCIKEKDWLCMSFRYDNYEEKRWFRCEREYQDQ